MLPFWHSVNEFLIGSQLYARSQWALCLDCIYGNFPCSRHYKNSALNSDIKALMCGCHLNFFWWCSILKIKNILVSTVLLCIFSENKTNSSQVLLPYIYSCASLKYKYPKYRKYFDFFQMKKTACLGGSVS